VSFSDTCDSTETITNMALLTISKAADTVGVTRQTLYRLIASGKVSATVAHDGSKAVDTTELLRHFGKLLSPDTQRQSHTDKKRQSHTDNVTPPAPATVTLQNEIERLRAQLQAKDLEITFLKQRIEDLTCDKKTFLEFVGVHQQRLLAPPKKSFSLASLIPWR